MSSFPINKMLKRKLVYKINGSREKISRGCRYVTQHSKDFSVSLLHLSD